MPRPPQQRTIKDMPEYDPDAEVMTLLLTLPSWTDKIRKTRESTDLTIISRNAAIHLERELIRHSDETLEMLRLLRKAQHGNEPIE